ncbi:MAG TPA: prolyl oligopeptidase family serine peptidase [Candidatus Dormibacteraeota bacterium]|nr:prolyl oligopeptidase family serine peptidase [Candidatus Dormibacteraeota bacterium]
MGYKQPPDQVVRILDAPPTPVVLPSPDGTRLLLVEREPHPPVALLARPYRRLAGVRVDPETGGGRVAVRIAALRLQDVDGLGPLTVRLPDDRSFGLPVWSPDGSWLAVVRHAGAGGKELWFIDPATGEARQVAGVRIADTLLRQSGLAMLGQPGPVLRWTPDGRLLAPALAGGQQAPPAAPPGPRIEETDGKRSQMHTFQDLLASEADDRDFARYATSQLVRVDPASHAVDALGGPGLYARVDPSPDGRYLLVRELRPPFSHRVPCPYFAYRVSVWDASGAQLATIADLPVADEVPRQGVPTGVRAVAWQANREATLVAVEALDGGDPRRPAPHRDRLLRWTPPFAAEPVEALRLAHRYAGSVALEQPDRLLLAEFDRDRRWTTTWLVDLAAPDDRRTVIDRSVNDAYGDPGSPVVRTTASGHEIADQDGDAIYLVGAGAGEDGDRPFLDRFDLATGATERLYQSGLDGYERFLCFVGGRRDRIVVERQTPVEPPNLHLVELDRGRRPLSSHRDPQPELSGAVRQLIRYRRADGVPLSGVLHLPPGWQPSAGRLPVLLWAYPMDYSDAGTAGQVRGSDRTFPRLEGATPLWALLRGWAVLTASVPVIGDPETMNDTFVEQITASAQAAIDELDRMEVIDRDRVVATGHSYGGFMTANLLAHTDLFAAGVARSGAYNRTLTPFGFQTERRSYWEAPDVYHRLSPFAHADRIRAPILLIHGADDANPGTYPMQSERLFQAIQGHGGTARLVILPHEDHAYRGRESLHHVVAETFEWLERHVPGVQTPGGQPARLSGRP